MDLVPAPAGVPDAVALPDSAARREDLQLLENLMNEVCQVLRIMIAHAPLICDATPSDDNP